MNKILLVAVMVFSAATTHAADTCQSKAVDKNGKPLASAAKTSYTKKCVSDALGG